MGQGQSREGGPGRLKTRIRGSLLLLPGISAASQTGFKYLMVFLSYFFLRQDSM